MKKISGHIKPRQSVVLQRFQFRQRAQLPGETFTTFALALQELASVCAFGCWQEKLILDQLIDKAADWRIREKLLMQVDTLTLAQAVELGSQMERVMQQTCPGFISVLTQQWESWSGSSKIWKIRNDAASSCSLPNLNFETNGPNLRSYPETSECKCELDSMSSIKCSRRNSVDSEETTGKRIKRGSTETMLTTDSFFYQSCFKPRSQPPLTRSEITESKTWHSVPENISAQSKTEYVGNCLHLTDKFRWSCSRIHLQGLDFEYTWKNLGRVPVSPEKAIKIEGEFGVERSLLDTDIGSNECQLSQPAGSLQGVDYLHSKSETCGLSPEAIGTCADSLSSTQTDASECSPKQKETSSALDCGPVIINAEELKKSDQYKAEGDLEADRFPCDPDVESGIGDTENLVACHVDFPAVIENRDCDCSVNWVSTATIQQKSLKENGLESELSGTEIMAGERWVDDSSNLDLGWNILETTLQAGGHNTGAEQKESMQQNRSCKTGALRNHSELVTNEQPTHEGEDGDSVFAVEMTPISDCVSQRRHLMTLPEFKPALIIVSVEQKGLQSKTLNDNLPTEMVAGTLRNVVSKDLMSPHTVSKAHDEPERVLSESCSCEEQILATHLIPGSAEVLPGRDTAEEKPEISQEEREKTDAVSSLGITCSNSMVASPKVEFRSVTVPLGNILTAESQADQCEEAPLKSHSRGDTISEKESCRTKTGYELEMEQFRKSPAGTRDDQGSEEEEFKAHQGREEGLCITSAVTLEACNVSSLCQGDGADVDLQEAVVISEQAVGRQGTEGCDVSKEHTGICEEPSRSEGKQGSPAEDTASPSKDSALNLDVSDVFNYAVKRETPNACMLGLDNISTCSTNSEEMDENSVHILGSSSSLYKAVQKPTKNGNSGKASRFLVFSKMTSFRKTKPATAENQGSSSFFGSKAKLEELDAGKEDEDTESLQSFKSCSSGSAFHRKESYASEYSDDDDLFYERPAGLFNRMSLRKASGSGRILMEDVDTNSTSPTLAAVKYADRQVSGSSENNDSEPVEYSGIRRSFPENEYKRSKNPEGKKFKTRLALAHKSLSSLFESKSPEKENTEQSSRVSLKNEKEKAKLRQSAWKAFLKSKEADGLKRPVLASLSPTQESLDATRGHIMRTTSVDRRDSSNGHTFFKTETANGSSTDTNYFEASAEPVDVSSPAGMWRKRTQSHDLGIRYSQSSDCDEQPEALSNSLNTSLEEYWMKSPFSPTDLQLAFSQSSPSCPQLSNSDGKDMPCRPMSPKPQSPRSASQHKSFRYPGRICATSMISLGNSSAVESNLEAPERPKTLKPRGSLLLSVHSLDNEYQRDDSGISSQSQISLNTASSISDMLRDEAGISPSITSAVAFDILPLKLHPFSQSTPTGLDCVGWKRRISSPGVYPTSSWT
ncbi:rho guanine nucleotide exchange factor 4 [Limosa lapponica baueri]|uniref:Rho guanine nucleotide exchange factor 4 n=1 Tax=Limosa lapponica baueri TaxID=1758121 RepID=A0A2I0TSI0_LIMLA|nr:rho guanine nucleotide exchange factor 4 [Limosa lapponica baueri]